MKSMDQKITKKMTIWWMLDRPTTGRHIREAVSVDGEFIWRGGTVTFRKSTRGERFVAHVKQCRAGVGIIVTRDANVK
jgi:hypothetical protein